jgi:MFS family permease
VRSLGEARSQECQRGTLALLALFLAPPLLKVLIFFLYWQRCKSANFPSWHSSSWGWQSWQPSLPTPHTLRSASQCLSLWQPQIIRSFGLTDMQTGILNALPFGIGSVLMVLWGQSSDRTGERVWHTAIPLALIAGSIVLGLSTNALLPTMIILCLAVVGTYAFKGPFWALSTEWLSAGAAAAGIAQINAIGNIGVFVRTYLLGIIKDATGSYPMGLLSLAVLSAAGCVAVLLLGRGQLRTSVASSVAH